MDIFQKLKEAEEKIAELEKENYQLREQFRRLTGSPASQAGYVNQSSPPYEKIALFLSLFKGRTDVFANLWVSADGRTGYSPAKASGSGKLMPLTDKVIYNHLSGRQTIGMYPLTKTNMCHVLVIDFDKKSWETDVRLLAETCKHEKLPFYIERSRSGEGAHIWFFFQRPFFASQARAFGKQLLILAQKQHPGTTLTSFDRMFPNQDKLREGGFGNLIALPLQKEPKKEGNTLFVNEEFIPYQDQWAYLSQIRKLSVEQLEEIIQRNVDDEGVKSEAEQTALPEKITIYLAEMIHVPRKRLPEKVTAGLQNLARFNNPAYFKAQAQRLSTAHIPQKIDCSRLTDSALLLPRGLLEDVKAYAGSTGCSVEIIDKQAAGEKADVHFYGTLKLEQEDALQALTSHDNGVLAAGTGFGKTVVSAAVIAKHQVNTLIVVHRQSLIEQWRGALSAFLQVPEDQIGQIGAGKHKPSGMLDIAMIQSLNKKERLRPEVLNYGQVIIDECHHISAKSFENTLKHIPAKRIYGLTATPVRKDGLHKIIYMHCGEIRYKTNLKKQAEERPFHHRLIIRETDFKTKEENIQKLYNILAHHEKRNDMIFNDVLEALDQKCSPVVLTERIDHIDTLYGKFRTFVKNLIVLTGDMTKKERAEAADRLASIQDDEEVLILATGKFIGEGYDFPRLDTLFLTMPVSWKGTLQQYVGRLHRTYNEKREVRVYDYADLHMPALKRMFENRMKGYRSLGYTTKKANGTGEQQLKLFE